MENISENTAASEPKDSNNELNGDGYGNQKEEKENDSNPEKPVDKICETPGCGKPAPMQCPKCRELKIITSNFCSQPCFKSYYSVHKQLHAKALLSQQSENRNNDVDLVMRYPSFTQTGTLLPYKQTPMKTVPRSIERPDYADDNRGIPHSEISSKRSGQILVLSPEEIDGK